MYTFEDRGGRSLTLRPEATAPIARAYLEHGLHREGQPVKLYPAGYSDVIGVGSTNLLDRRSAFSNYDVSSAKTAAPGEALVTTFPGNHYAGVWGTSFSGALVSGGVALLLQARHSASPDEVEDALEHGAEIEQQVGERLELVSSIQYLLQKKDSRKRKD